MSNRTLFKFFIGVCVLMQSSWGAANDHPTSLKASTLSCQSAIVVDEQSGAILWQKNSKVPRYPASTTKIMTALLLLEKTQPDDWITAPKDVEKVTGASLHLIPGEKIKARDLTYAILLRSANDACHAAAIHIAGSVPAFAKLMNSRAKQIGCVNTKFNNPHGLNDDKHTTCAYDLALIGREAMKRSDFRQLVATQKYRITTRTKNQEDILLKTHNKYLKKDTTADGIKTGWTNPAGKCYVGSATRDGYRLITVVLKSKDWMKDHALLLDWAFSNHVRKQFSTASAKLGELPLESAEKAIPFGALNDLSLPIPRQKYNQIKTSLRFLPNLIPPLQENQLVGEMLVIDGEKVLAKAPLVALESVGKRSLFSSRSFNHTLVPTLLLVSGVYIWKRRMRVF